jgi:alkyl sulfatase BDS1-like metallo-beta-lactamase superfamily hydrolase
VAGADATITLSKAVLNDIQLGKTTLDKAVADGSAKIDGNAAIVSDFLASMDSFKFWFNIVTP